MSTSDTLRRMPYISDAIHRMITGSTGIDDPEDTMAFMMPALKFALKALADAAAIVDRAEETGVALHPAAIDRRDELANHAVECLATFGAVAFLAALKAEKVEG